MQMVGSGVGVLVGVDVGVHVAVGVKVLVGVQVAVGVQVGVLVDVAVGVRVEVGTTGVGVPEGGVQLVASTISARSVLGSLPRKRIVCTPDESPMVQCASGEGIPEAGRAVAILQTQELEPVQAPSHVSLMTSGPPSAELKKESVEAFTHRVSIQTR
jgi:hypothetical protein